MEFQDGRGSDGETPEFNLAGQNALAATAVAQGRGTVLMPSADNVVVLPAGATLDDLSVQGRDIVVTLSDGRIFVIPDGAVYVPQIIIGDVAVPPLNLAALLTGHEPQPAAGPVQSSGGNFADPTDPIQAAHGLGDLLPYTELSFSAEQQEEVIPDLVDDDDPDVIIETPDNPAGAIDAIATVDEEGLPARGNEPAGTAAETDAETTTGTIVFNSPDGTSAVLINGEEITAVGQSFTSPSGTLTITSIDLAGGRIGFSYTLADNMVGVTADGFFTMTVVDADGDAATASLQINVVDDGPIGLADTDTVAAGTFGPIEGNVIANDVPGADGFPGGGATAVTGFASTTETGVPGGTVSGIYGELTLNADGTYSYTRSPGTPGGVEDHFTYSIVDGDGTAATNIQLTITIEDSPPAIVAVPEIGEGTEVNENQLPPTTDTRSQEAPGSQFVAGPETTMGTITFHSDDGVSSVSLGGTVITPGSLPQVVASDATGTLTVVGYAYDPATGDGSVTYVYTLTDNTANTDGSTVSFPITVVDADGDTASDTLNIHIIDDAPDAVNDSAASVTEDASGTIGGNVLANDTQGADGAVMTSVTIDGTAHAIAAAGTTSVSTANGAYTFDAAGNWTFHPTTGLDQTGGDVDASFRYTLTDGDGDTDTALQPISITDGAAPSAGEPISLSVDDENLAGGSNPATPVTDAGDIVFTPGSDAIDTIVFGADLTGLDSSLTWVRVDDATITGSDGATLIVTLELTRTGDTATVTATLSDNFDAHPAIDADDLKALGSVDVVATDIDGDTATSSVSVSISDDVPAAADDSAAQATENAAFTISVFGNDTFGADGVDTANAAKVFVSSQASQGTVTYDAATGLFTYTPNPGAGSASTADSFEYTIVDGDGDTATATVGVTLQADSEAQGGETVARVDDDGLAGGNPASTVGDIDANTDDHPADTSEASFTGTLGFDVGNDTPATITFGASLDGSTATIGLETVTYSVSGSTLTATITGGARDDTPLFQVEILDSQTGEYKVTLLANVLNSGGPNDEAQNAFASIDFTVTDSDGDTASTNLGIVFNDDAPTAVADSGGVSEGQSVSGDVLTNDVPGADGLAASPKGAVAGIFSVNEGTVQTSANGAGKFVLAGEFGTLTLGRDGSYTYESDPNAISSDEQDVFEYTIVDGDGDTSTATLTIDLTNVALVADNQGKTVHEAALDLVADDRSGTANDDLAAGSVNGSNPGADTETVSGTLDVIGATGYVLVGSAAGAFGQIQINTDGTYTYTLTGPVDGDTTAPAQGGDNGGNTYTGNGVETFTYEASDADGNTVQGTITISIVDDVPTAFSNTTSVTEGAVVSGNVLNDATDDVLGADGAAAGGAVTGVATGSDTSNPVSGSLGGAGITGAYGTLILNANGTYSYDADPDVLTSGTVIDHFVYTITDSDGDTSTTTLDITINNVTVTASDSDAVVDEKGLAAGGSGENADGIPGNGSDQSEVFTAGAITPSGGTGPYGYALTSPATGSYGTLVLNTDGTYTYTLTSRYDTSPDADNSTNTEQGRDSFSYTVTDANGNTATGTILVDIVDDVPTATADGGTLTENTASVDGNVLANDAFGADGPHASERIVSVSGSAAGVVGGNTAGNYGTLHLNLDGTYTYVLDTAAVQGLDDTEQVTDTFSYTIKDGDGDTSTAQLTVTITGANDAPVANDDTNWVLDVTSGPNPTTTGNVLQNLDHAGAPSGTFGDVADTDVDAETLTVTGVTGGTVGNSLPGSHGSIVINANGSYTYTLNASNSAVNGLAAGETLTDSFTYTVSDGTTTDTATVTITIFGTNDAPVVTGSAVAVSEEGLTGGLPDDNPTSPDDADTTNSVTATGSITITDADTSDTHTVALGVPTQTLYTPDGVTALTWVLTDSHTLKGYSTNINNPEILVTIDDDGDYAVTLGGPVRHLDDTLEDLTSFVIPVTVDDGTATTTLNSAITVTIEDDSPIAGADSGSVTEGYFTSGNVLLDSDVGADRTATWPDGTVTGIAHPALGTSDIVPNASGDFVLVGEFGTLTLNRNGGYIYQSNANATSVSDQDVFQFTMVDADGDSSTQTLIFDVLNVTLVADNQTKQVDEAALDTTTSGSDLGHGAITGSNPTSTAETVTGTLAVTGPTGAVTYVAQSVTTAYGIFQLNSNGTYTYTLTNPYTTTPSANNGAVVEPAVETFTYTAHDLYGNSVTGTVKIDVKDDVPQAVTAGSTSIANVASGTSTAYLDGDHDVGNNYGADGAGAVIFTAATINSLESQNLTSGLVDLDYTITNGGTTLTATKSTDSSVVFTIELQPSAYDDQYKVTIDQPLDSTQKVDFTDGTYDFVGGNTPWAGFVPDGQSQSGGVPVNDDSHDLLLTPFGGNGTSGDAVNGNANSAGVSGGGGGQNIGSNEGIRLDYVTDLTGNPAGSPANYDGNIFQQDHHFDNHYQVNDASVRFGDGSTNTTISVKAFDANDSTDLVYHNGTLVNITQIVISYDGENQTFAFDPLHLSQTLSVGSAGGLADRNYTVSWVESSPGSGDYYVKVTGVLDSNVRISTHGETTYEAIEIQHISGDDFALTGFGAVTVTNDPVDFTVPISIQDGDGDIVSSGTLAVTANSVIPPIALDLDGDGVEFLSLTDGVTHDYGAGLVQTAWVAPDDGLLAHDTGNGLDILFTDDAAGAATDLEGLRLAYDSNGDGKLTAADADFGDFGVWQDANSNGIVDEGEYQSLLKMGITSIDLTASGPGSTEAGGDVVVHGTAQYTMNGTAYSLADVSFATADADSRIAARTAEIAAVSLAAAGFMTSEAVQAQPLPPVATEVVAAALETFEAPQPETQVSLPESSEATTPVALPEDQAPHDQEIPSSSHPDADGPDEGAQHSLGEVVQQDFAPEPLAASDEGPVQTSTPALSFGELDGSLMQALLLAAQAKEAGASEQGANAGLPAIKEAIAESAGQQAIDALIDHFAGNDAPHAAPDVTGAEGADHALGAMLASAGVDGLHAGMAAGFEMAAMAAAAEAHSMAVA